jgi:hypothetical protein
VIRRIALCYLFLAYVLLVQAEMAQGDEQVSAEWSEQ